MPATSAALLVYRAGPEGPEVLLAHPGGPYWARRHLGAWSIPKGAPQCGEPLEAAARREFLEETGLSPPQAVQALEPVRTRSGKTIHCWLAEADLDLRGFRSNAFAIEWPPRSGRSIRAPEVDGLRYAAELEAMRLIHPGQRPLLVQAFRHLGEAPTWGDAGLSPHVGR